jgi:uncharacterized protein YjbI with pentapeptide repeats/outer membrane protein assembly factor BamB
MKPFAPLVVVATSLAISAAVRGDIFRWDTGEVIPGTEGIEPGPGIDLSDWNSESRNLRVADFGDYSEGFDLTGANFSQSWLEASYFGNSILTQADLSGASLKSASFEGATLAQANLSGANLAEAYVGHANLDGADFSGARLMRATFDFSTLGGVNFSSTDLAKADLGGYATSRGFTKEQLYSTASYQSGDLRGMRLVGSDLTNWDFTDKDLTGAYFSPTNLAINIPVTDLTGALFSGAIVRDVVFGGRVTLRGFTNEQLYSTASYRSGDLQGIRLEDYDMTRWNLADKNLTATRFGSSELAEADFQRSVLVRADLIGADLTGADFQHADLKNSFFWLINEAWSHAHLLGADLSFADLRGAWIEQMDGAILRNTIDRTGNIKGLRIEHAERLVIKDDHVYAPGRNFPDELRPPIAISVLDEFTIAADGLLRIEFQTDDWDSLISFDPGILVNLSGTLELIFAEGVDVTTQVGRKLHIFDWTGVEPTGVFVVASPYLWDLTNLYSTGEVRLTGTGGIADYDQSGIVDQADLDFVLLNWGADATSPPAGWVNDIPRGSIDQEELDKVLLNWGSMSTSVAAAGVPEPSTVILAMLMVVLLWATRGCRRAGGAFAVCLSGLVAGSTAHPVAAQDVGVPPEVAANADQWPMANGNYAGTRATFAAEIDSTNVHRLEVAWRFPLPTDNASSFGVLSSNPLILDDVVYLQDWGSLGGNLFAVDLHTGELVWERTHRAAVVGPNGPAVGWDKVFAAIGPSTIAALDKQSGEELWRVTLGRQPAEGIDIQPIVYDGLVYTSTVPGNWDNFYVGGTTGVIHALDQQTGEVRWRFDTVDSEDIWGNAAVNSGGGAWYPPTIDVERGVTYWGTGNPAPWPGTVSFPNGSSRPGPNLYTNSVVALDHDTGELAWYTQARPHDIFDLDFQNSPVLATLAIDGQPRDIAIGSGKTGTVIAMDRDTGEILWETPVGIHLNDDLEEVPAGQTVDVFPGDLGGIETPIAYADGVVYAPVLNRGVTYSPTGQVGSMIVGTPQGELTAIAADTGQELWTTDFSAWLVGGATVVNDLVFTSTYDGQMVALNRETGEVRWALRAPGGINAWPAVAGEHILFPVGLSPNPVLLALELGEGPLVGDYSDNGMVEQRDLTLVLRHWGRQVAGLPSGWNSQAPIGSVDQEELDKVLLNWGTSAAPAPSPGAVPEPAAFGLALVVIGVARRLVRPSTLLPARRPSGGRPQV